jgi:hypothetical protein
MLFRETVAVYCENRTERTESESELLNNWRSVSQSVCLGVEPNLGLLTRDIIIIIFFESYILVLFGAPSLTRGRVCHLSVYSQSTVVGQYLHNLYTICVTHKSHVQYLTLSIYVLLPVTVSSI